MAKKIHKMVLNDRLLKMHELEDITYLTISKSAVNHILNENLKHEKYGFM